MTNTPNNVGDRAGVAARAASAPWWQALMTVACAALIASLYARPSQGWTSMVTAASGIVLVVASMQWRKRRGVRAPATVGRSAWLHMVVLFATVAVVFFAAIVLRNALPPTTALAFGVQFLSAITLLGVGEAVRVYLDRRVRKEHSRVAASDHDPHG
ncbi:MAG TPA: hypothetical protein VN888_13400 [Mycobacterium sp.]|nr:hypothetical protein [Mycobacterium sp.]